VWVWAGLLSLVAVAAFSVLYHKTRNRPGVGFPVIARGVETTVELK
jgi:hypothetical protein